MNGSWFYTFPDKVVFFGLFKRINKEFILQKGIWKSKVCRMDLIVVRNWNINFVFGGFTYNDKKAF
jgi:hypothetical protein